MSEKSSETASVEQEPTTATELDLATVQSTFKIINTLVDHVDASSSLIAIMASNMGEAITRQITETAAWANFLTARRALEALRPELERFVATATKIAESQPPQPTEEEKR